MLKRQHWHEVVVGAQHQRQEHCSHCRWEEKTGAERGESIRLSDGWKLKEQKRQMKRIRWIRGRNETKAKRNEEKGTVK